MDRGTEAQKYVWEGAIPLQIHLHDSEVTTLPPPPPALILAPRIGYLPLLVPHIKPFFSSALPPGVDTVWFEYRGLPLKWYIPTGVLFDLLCAEPERPWNLTVHFRGYPANILIPCEGEDSVKWSFINSLKEAAYIINGNCKNVMNMSQSDQVELWHSVMNGNLEAYLRVSSKLKLGIGGDEFSAKLNSSSLKSQQSTVETDTTGSVNTGRIPVRLYVCNVHEDFDDLEDAPIIDSWDKISYINRPVEIHGEGSRTRGEKKSKLVRLIQEVEIIFCTTIANRPPRGQAIRFAALCLAYLSTTPRLLGSHLGSNSKMASCHCIDCLGVTGRGKCFTLLDALKTLLPEFFAEKSSINEEISRAESCILSDNVEIKLLRIQGIEPKLEIPFAWLVNNLMNPERFLHICVYVRVLEPITI
ncbi:hypothetical protein HYC85_005172 [Camellia sinensis]|uniref:Autophagy protein 5 n=1 Tax=Camellia sinensis TaxID=4442 RepID=A0A7J7HZX7_CAMSI|nr:hypothetical protein HYC85_005172 [Camellia sinensis]